MYSHIVKALMTTPWAIMPSKLEAIVEFVMLKANGEQAFDKPNYEAKAGRPRASKQGNVAVIPVHGVVSQRMNMLQEFSGGVSTELLTAQINEAVADSSVKAIVLDIDSPGGSVYGVSEVSDVIYAAREQKHITAVANSLAASAAYWIGSAASEFVVTPGGDVGSIGVYTAHQDVSALEENMGVKTTLISAGKHKVTGNPYEPLSEEALGQIQSSVDDYYDMFTSAVAKHRGVSVSDVKNGYGEGRVLGAKEALKAGMVDRVATFDEVINKLGGDMSRLRRAKVNMI